MPYSAKDILDGWDTYAGWEKEGFHRTSTMVSLKRVHIKLAAHSFASKMFSKKDMKSAAIDIESWELMVKDHSTWQHLVKEESSMQRIHETHDKWRRDIREKQ